MLLTSSAEEKRVNLAGFEQVLNDPGVLHVCSAVLFLCLLLRDHSTNLAQSQTQLVTCRRSVISSGYSGFLHQKTDFIIIISPP